MAQVVKMTSHLDEIKPVQKTRMPECLTDLTARLGRREIVMIFSDFFTNLDDLEPALQRLRFNRHEVLLFQVMHHDELDFTFDGMVKFVGLELPEEHLTQPDDIRQTHSGTGQDRLQIVERESELGSHIAWMLCVAVGVDGVLSAADELSTAAHDELCLVEAQVH